MHIYMSAELHFTKYSLKVLHIYTRANFCGLILLLFVYNFVILFYQSKPQRIVFSWQDLWNFSRVYFDLVFFLHFLPVVYFACVKMIRLVELGKGIRDNNDKQHIVLSLENKKLKAPILNVIIADCSYT